MGCVRSSLEGKSANYKYQNGYKQEEQLRDGCFGQVRVLHKRTGEKRIAKLVDLAGTQQSDSSRMKLAQQEIRVYQRLGAHPNVVQMVQYFGDEEFCAIILELCEQTLEDQLPLAHKMEDRSIEVMLHGIFYGLSYMHRKKVVHRNLQTESILLRAGVAKISNFEFSTGLWRKAGKSGTVELTSRTGNEDYMSPEMASGLGYNEKTDTWSAGVITYRFISGKFPFDRDGSDTPSYTSKSAKLWGNDVLKQAWVHAKLLEAVDLLEGELRPARGLVWAHAASTLIQNLLQHSPETRFSAKEALHAQLFNLHEVWTDDDDDEEDMHLSQSRSWGLRASKMAGRALGRISGRKSLGFIARKSGRTTPSSTTKSPKSIVPTETQRSTPIETSVEL